MRKLAYMRGYRATSAGQCIALHCTYSWSFDLATGAGAVAAAMFCRLHADARNAFERIVLLLSYCYAMLNTSYRMACNKDMNGLCMRPHVVRTQIQCRVFGGKRQCYCSQAA